MRFIEANGGDLIRSDSVVSIELRQRPNHLSIVLHLINKDEFTWTKVKTGNDFEKVYSSLRNESRRIASMIEEAGK